MTCLLDGAKIERCFDVVSKCGNEIEVMSDNLKQLFLNPPSRPWTWSGDPIYEYRQDESGWVVTDYIWGMPIGRRSNSNQKMMLGFQISLTGDGVNFSKNNISEPLVHIFLWDVSCIGFDSHYMFFPLPKEYSPEITSGRLIEWPLPDLGWPQRKSAWIYSLKLTSLNSHKDLIDKIVTPALGLLSGEDVKNVLRDDISGLVRYEFEDLMDESSSTPTRLVQNVAQSSDELR